MRKRLVFRVDDIGYTPAYDIGAFKVFECGIGTSADVMFDAKNTIENSIDAELLRTRDYLNVKLALRKALTNYLNKKLKRKPLIVPILIESND